AWMSHTDEISACLALWDDTSQRLTISGVYPSSETYINIGQQIAPAHFPPTALLPDQSQSESQLVKLLAISTAQRDWGVLAMRGSIESYAYTDMIASLLGTALERLALQDSIKEQQTNLSESYERERALIDTIYSLGSPVIRLLPKLLLVPLVGV